MNPPKEARDAVAAINKAIESVKQVELADRTFGGKSNVRTDFCTRSNHQTLRKAKGKCGDRPTSLPAVLGEILRNFLPSGWQKYANLASKTKRG